MNKKQNILQRFSNLVDTDAGGDECWNWKGYTDSNGRCMFRVGDKRMAASRFSYEQAVGPVPSGYVVMHSCNNPSCVNPKHLRVGSQSANMLHCSMAGRNSLAKLTPADVLKIRTLLRSSTHRAIAAMFGVTKSTITSINRGTTYSWVEEIHNEY